MGGRHADDHITLSGPDTPGDAGDDPLE